MNLAKKSLTLGVALSLAVGTLALMSPAARAADGTITINGQLTSATCSISVNGGGANYTVTLPTMQTSDFKAAGTAAGYTAFTIALSGCTAGSGSPAVTKVLPYFEQGPNTDLTSGYLQNVAATTPATGVEVMLSTGNTLASALKLQNAAGAQGGAYATLSTNPSFTYYAAYVSTAEATAGLVNTSVQYDLSYQ